MLIFYWFWQCKVLQQLFLHFKNVDTLMSLSIHRYVNIQVQAGTRDCDVFAIANALSIVNGEDPFKKMFDHKRQCEGI